jgi:hypothetical protein
LCKSVNKYLNWVMPFTLLSLALLAAQTSAAPAQKAQTTQIVQASVEILAAEEIRFEQQPVQQRGRNQTHRQRRTRNGMPMTEFY